VHTKNGRLLGDLVVALLGGLVKDFIIGLAVVEYGIALAALLDGLDVALVGLRLMG
jgi:hypothetical protein